MNFIITIYKVIFKQSNYGRTRLFEQESMASWIHEEHPEGLGGRTKTKINQQESQIKSKKTTGIKTQLITQKNTSRSRAHPPIPSRPYVMDVRLGQ